MAESGPDQYESARADANLAKKIVYAILAFDLVVIVAYRFGYLPPIPAGVLYWGSGFGIIGLIRKVESKSHPDQRGWWTVLLLATGGLGFLSWLRHLDRDH